MPVTLPDSDWEGVDEAEDVIVCDEVVLGVGALDGDVLGVPETEADTLGVTEADVEPLPVVDGEDEADADCVGVYDSLRDNACDGVPVSLGVDVKLIEGD